MLDDNPQAQAPEEGRCHIHPEREASGLCRACGRLVCMECANKVHGINYCVECLSTLENRSASDRPSTQPGIKLVHRVGSVMVFLCLVFIAMATAYGLPAFRASLPKMDEKLSKNQEAAQKNQIFIVSASLERFKTDVGRRPTMAEGLPALWDNDPDRDGQPIPGWRGPYAALEHDDFYDDEDNLLWTRDIEIYYMMIEADENSGQGPCFKFLYCPGPDYYWDSVDEESAENFEPWQTAWGDDQIVWLGTSECE